MKRTVDIVVAIAGLVLTAPLTLPVVLIVWLQDFHSPFYVAPRVGRGFHAFKILKLRSMVVNADRSGVDSTSSDDTRITPIGRFIRRYKLDELSQLINVLKGDMSLVGPRPNVQREVDLYTDEERHLLDIRPGITDLSSIVFSDEGDILEGADDPDLRYNQVIRPWKSRLGLLYVRRSSLLLDLQIMFLTGLTVVSRSRALRGVAGILQRLDADERLIRVAARTAPLQAHPPPGTDDIVSTRGPEK